MKYPKSFFQRLSKELKSLRSNKSDPSITQEQSLKLSIEEGLIDPNALGIKPGLPADIPKPQPQSFAEIRSGLKQPTAEELVLINIENEKAKREELDRIRLKRTYHSKNP